MKKVFICSPFKPVGVTSPEERRRSQIKNESLARTACRMAVEKGCVPMAPHLYFPQFLDDSVPEERETSIMFGLTWLKGCDEIWVVGNDVTKVMEREIRSAWKWEIPIKRVTTPQRALLSIR